MKWMVITEIWRQEEGFSYWYYDIYNDRNQANEAANNFINAFPCSHMVIREDEAKEWGVRNLPSELTH